MDLRHATSIAIAAALLACPSTAQGKKLGAKITGADPTGGPRTHLTIPGSVNDLTTMSDGRVLYCTEEGEVGTFESDGTLTVLADAQSGPFPMPLRGVVETPGGDVAVMDELGDIYVLPGESPPAQMIYDDLYMIQNPTDLLVDQSGNYVIVSATPSNGLRAINWINPDGSRWAYYLVEHGPVSLAPDPLTGGLIMADEDGQGGLRLIDVSDDTHPAAALETTFPYGFDADENDGDLAVDDAGNVLTIAGGRVMRLRRATGVTNIVAQGFAQLRGIAIAPGSGNLPSRSVESIYVAAGRGPTTIVELPNGGTASPPVAAPLGTVPYAGEQRLFFPGGKVYELAVDNDGCLLTGGDFFGATPSVRRIDMSTFTITTIADDTDGISGRIEGVVQAEDDTIYAVTIDGVIHAITENPTIVTTVFSDPLNQVTVAKDLGLKEDGTFYIADREGFGPGEVLAVSGGVATSVMQRSEARGITPHPHFNRFFVSQWNATGFDGSVVTIRSDTHEWWNTPGFFGMNYSNSQAWSDGDLVADTAGNVYSLSEDDWRIVRWNLSPAARYGVVGSMYTGHNSGLAITISSAGSGSTTGWSLYVSDFDRLWELPSYPPPGRKLIPCASLITGDVTGWFPHGTKPVAMIPDPDGQGLLVVTNAGTLARLSIADGEIGFRAGAQQGLSGELVGLAARSTGRIVVANREGEVFEVDPGLGWRASKLFADPDQALAAVSGITVDGADRVHLVEGGEGPAARVYRIEDGALELLGHTNRGLRPTVDPLTGEIWVSELGQEGQGGILRLDAHGETPATGHVRVAPFRTFAFGAADGDLAFDASGDVYVAEGAADRVVRVDRETGAVEVLGANYEALAAVAVTEGSPDVAGAQGASLFVLDGWTIYEIGIDERPAPRAPATRPAGSAPADLRVHGRVAPGETLRVSIDSPADAGRMHIVVASLDGRAPGFELARLGDASDTRVVPSNALGRWRAASRVGSGFLGFLDGSGRSSAEMSLVIPNDPSILGWERFLDLAWVAVDPSAPNRVATVGGTAQLFLGR